MDEKARLRTILQLVGAGRRRIERAEEHCIKGGIQSRINKVLNEIHLLERELKSSM